MIKNFICYFYLKFMKLLFSLQLFLIKILGAPPVSLVLFIFIFVYSIGMYRYWWGLRDVVIDL